MNQAAPASKEPRAGKARPPLGQAAGSRGVSLMAPRHGVALVDAGAMAAGLAAPAANDRGGIALSPPAWGPHSLDLAALSRVHGEVTRWLEMPASSLPVRVDALARQKTEAHGTPGLMERGVVYLHPQRFDPASAKGKEILAHEAIHVRQRANRAAAHGSSRGAAELEASFLARDFAAGGSARRPVEGLPQDAVAAFAGGGEGTLGQALATLPAPARSKLAPVANFLAKVAGKVELHGNVVSLAVLDSPFKYDAGVIHLQGRIRGKLAYTTDTGSVDGSIASDDAKLTIPGANGGRPIAIQLRVAGGTGGLNVAASLRSPVDVNRFTKLKSLSAKYENDRLTIEGVATITVAGGKVKADASVIVDSAEGVKLKDGQVTAKPTLPIIGEVEGQITFADNSLVSIRIEARRKAVQFPAASRLLSGVISGTATWNAQTGALAGTIAGELTARVPGLSPFKLNLSLHGNTGTKELEATATLAQPVPLNSFLTLTAAELAYRDGRPSLVLTGGLKMGNRAPQQQGRRAGAGRRGAGAGAGAQGSLTARIDDAGFAVEGGSASLEIPAAGVFCGGRVEVSYAQRSLKVDGSAAIGIGSFTVLARLQGKDGIFDATVAIPGELPAERNSLKNGRLVLLAGRQLAEKRLKLPRIEIPIFSVAIATLTAEVGVDLGFGVNVDDLSVSGSVHVKGIDLGKQSFERATVAGSVQSGIHLGLTFAPTIGLGLSVFHPKLLGVSGGLALDATATAGVGIQGNVALSYAPHDGLSVEDARIAAPLSISLEADPRLFVHIGALFDLLSHEWRTEKIASLQILKDKQICVVELDLKNPSNGIQVRDGGGKEQPAEAPRGPAGMTVAARQPSSPSRSSGRGPAGASTAVAPKVTQPSAPLASAPESKAGMFDFSMLYSVLEAVAPKPIKDLKATLERVWNTIKKIWNSIVKFFDWVAARVRRIVSSSDQLQALVEQVLARWQAVKRGDLTQLVGLISGGITLIQQVARRFGKELETDGKLKVLREPKSGVLGDWSVPDIFHITLEIPGIIDWNDVGLPNVLGLIETICGFLGIAWGSYVSEQRRAAIADILGRREERERRLAAPHATLQFLDAAGQNVGTQFDLNTYTPDPMGFPRALPSITPDIPRRAQRVKVTNLKPGMRVVFVYRSNTAGGSLAESHFVALAAVGAEGVVFALDENHQESRYRFGRGLTVAGPLSTFRVVR